MQLTELRLSEEREQTLLNYCNRTRISGITFMIAGALLLAVSFPLAVHSLYQATGGLLGYSILEVPGMLARYRSYRRRSPGSFAFMWAVLLIGKIFMDIKLHNVVWGKDTDWRCIRDGRYRYGYITVSRREEGKQDIFDEEGLRYRCVMEHEYRSVSYGTEMLGIWLENGHRFALLDQDHPEINLPDY